ncbi:MAG: galactose oxidase-like domain-containing protein [Actinomycetota bacterium]
MHRTRAFVALAAVLAVLGTMIVSTALPASAADPSVTGQFEPLFSEGNVALDAPPDDPTTSAKDPTAVSSVALPNGNFLYWNGLENLENATTPLAADGGYVASLGHPSRSRLMSNPGSSATWQVPTPEGGGGGDMFCSDQRILLDGTVMDTGGTVWKDDPVNLRQYAPVPDNVPGGTTELFGNRATRIYNPDTNSWSQVGTRDPANDNVEGTPDASGGGSGSYTGYMHYGRWYPALLTLPNGKLFVAGGVGRLLYNSTGFNVANTETFNPFNSSGAYDPVHGSWTDNGASGASTFPLFPRLHVIADGKIFYGANGQMWGPFGQAADEALWNFPKLYNPATNTWSNATGPGNGSGLPDPLSDLTIARSGAAEIMLPFTPDANGNYNTTTILQAGGVIGTSPGTFIATNKSRLLSIDKNDNVTFSDAASTNNARWYSDGILGATGEPMIFSGADKDEVICGGCEVAVRQAEMYDVSANKWIPMASASRDRTYHNSAILLADGRVMTGGHSPINFLYGPGGTGPTGNNSAHDANLPAPLNFANNFKDPTFQIFDPPYLFRGPRPTITTNISGWLNWGNDYNITTPDAATVDDAILVHMPATTHITDADARAIVLPITQRLNGSVKVHIPSERGVAIPGWYYLFLRQTNPGFSKPTVSKSAIIVRVGNPSALGLAAASTIGGAHVTHVASVSHIATVVTHGVKASISAIAPKTAPVSSRSTSSSGTAAAMLASLIAAAAITTRAKLRRKSRI